MCAAVGTYRCASPNGYWEFGCSDVVVHSRAHAGPAQRLCPVERLCVPSHACVPCHCPPQQVNTGGGFDSDVYRQQIADNYYNMQASKARAYGGNGVFSTQ